MKQLNQIIKTLREETAFSFAEKKLEILRGQKDYEETMKKCYSGKDNPTIEECEENAIRTFVSEYAKMCEIYSGWIKNGKVFILDKRDRFVLALYKVDDIAHKAISHYNPLNIDCIEQSTSNKHFFEQLNIRFDISADEEMLIKECDELVKMTIDRVGL
jgi:hypothetical protein